MLADRVISIIAKTKGLPVEKISLDSSFEELGIDSLSGIAIAYEIEQEFNISIPNEDAMGIRSVREMVDGLQKLLSEGTGNAAETIQS